MDVKGLLKFHWGRYPLMQSRDFYKLIFQGVYGVGHIMGGKAQGYLMEEAMRVDLHDYLGRELVEVISPDGLMVRVYLRPFMRKGLNLDALYRVMVRSADLNGVDEVFKERWRVFKELVELGTIDASLDEVRALDEEMEQNGIMPKHHTDPYRDAYYPAYRVVWKPYLLEEFPDL